MNPPNAVWDGVLRRLHSDLPEYALEAWVQPLEVVEEAGAVRLFAPTPFHQRRIETRFLEAIRKAANEEAGRDVKILLGLMPPRATASGAGPSDSEADASRAADGSTSKNNGVRFEGAPAGERAAATPAARPTPQRPAQLALPHRFDTFVVGPPNALAREAAVAVSRGLQPGVTPLCLVGPSGSGKSHLAHALIGEARRSGASRALCVSAEAFTSDLMASIRGGRTREFKRRYRSDCDLLVVEDVQFFEGKRSTQLELFHTIEYLRGVGRSVVLTADRLPRDIPRLDPRLSSEMASGLVAVIEPPDAQLRRAILRAKAAAGGIRLPDDCLDLLVSRVRGSVRDLDGVLRQLVASAALMGRRIDLTLAEEALYKIAPIEETAPHNVPQVIDAVAGFFGVPAHTLASPSRSRRVLVPRQLAMYLCHQYTDASLAEIGRALGREHTAVRNAIQKIEREILERAPLRYQLEALVERLKARSA